MDPLLEFASKNVMSPFVPRSVHSIALNRSRGSGGSVDR
jgi:hypothetical protein